MPRTVVHDSAYLVSRSRSHSPFQTVLVLTLHSPTCRLDLDPLQTLKSPEPHQANVRPAATGSGRTTPHPYRRDRPNRTQTPSETPVAQPEIPQPPRFTFTFNFPAPPPVTSPTTASSQDQQQHHLPQSQSDANPPLAAPMPIHLNVPLPAENIFGGPTRSSPAPLSPPQPSSPALPHTLTSASNGTGTGTTAQPDGAEGNRARPERRPHITIVHGEPPGSPPVHQLNGPNDRVPLLPQPHFHMFPPPPRPGSTPGPLPSQSAPARTPSPFVPRSLESWASDREKALGLRCDAPECSLAPSPDGDLPSRPTGEGKDMLSIFAPDQSPFSHKPLAGEFTHLACAHRWHRDCLESEERSAGRWNIGEDGRVWVRCGLCRKDGWVVSGEVAEEELVEGLVAEA
jgi:hypothetical protein